MKPRLMDFKMKKKDTAKEMIKEVTTIPEKSLDKMKEYLSNNFVLASIVKEKGEKTGYFSTRTYKVYRINHIMKAIDIALKEEDTELAKLEKENNILIKQIDRVEIIIEKLYKQIFTLQKEYDYLLNSKKELRELCRTAQKQVRELKTQNKELVDKIFKGIGKLKEQGHAMAGLDELKSKLQAEIKDKKRRRSPAVRRKW